MKARSSPGAELAALVARAARARDALWDGRTDIGRLVHDAADGLPQLQVDRFGPLAVVQAYDASWQPQLPAVADAILRAGSGVTGVRAMVRLPGGKPGGTEVRAGSTFPDEFTAQENGSAFRIRASDDSLNVGIFPDARPARERVRQLSRGAAVLNLFAYAGGFTVAALAGGAVQVDHVDTNAKMATWGARNVVCNGWSARACRFIVEDAGHFAARMARQGRRYGVVVLDPPTFGRSARGAHTNDALADLCADAFRVLEHGGRLLVANNTRSMGVDALWRTVDDAARTAGTAATWEDTLRAGWDFPRSAEAPELDRFKMIVARRG